MSCEEGHLLAPEILHRYWDERAELKREFKLCSRNDCWEAKISPSSHRRLSRELADLRAAQDECQQLRRADGEMLLNGNVFQRGRTQPAAV